MKAVVYDRFGPPEVLRIVEKERPMPREGELLVRVRASTVEKEDPDMRAKRGFNGLIRPKHQTLGMYFSGEVESSPSPTSRFRKGDQVMGSTNMKMGCWAEYVCVAEEGSLVAKPESMTHEEAASILNGSLTAFPFLREKADVQPGQRVLVYGASGSVGTMAVQIAKRLGADVTGVCSTSNLEFVKGLGADRVIDYTAEDFTSRGDSYDVIFDTVGKTSFSRCRNSLTENGIFLATVPSLAIVLRGLRSSRRTGRRTGFAATGLRKPAKKRMDLEWIATTIASDGLLPTIDSVYGLEEMAAAHIRVAGGHKRGSVIIRV